MIIKKVLIILIVIMTSCHGPEKGRLDTFIWIRHNANWIRDTSQLKARVLIVYNDSSKQINIAKQFISKNENEFFTTKSTDTLENLIYNSLYNKVYSTNYKLDLAQGPYIYDGDVYLIIYKFSNQTERFINYIPPELPDSLVKLTEYLDKFSYKSGLNLGVQFDINTFFNKYKHYYLDYLKVPPTMSHDSARALK